MTKKERAAMYARNRKYGIRDADYQKMLTDQNKRCAICGTETGLVVDHCHVSRKVRGLLCHNCNIGLGQFKDNIRLLQHAQKYLEENQEFGIWEVIELKDALQQKEEGEV